MKKYTPKRLLKEAIESIKTELNTIWSSSNVEHTEPNAFEEGALCKSFSDLRNCKQCPLHQFSENHDETNCGDTFLRVIDNPSRKNARAVRKELKAVLSWLEAQ